MSSIDHATTRKRRASKPKTRTGCKTCKLRRVKCDEAEPNCKRCSRFGHKCLGYNKATQVNNNFSPTRSLEQKLLPKPHMKISYMDRIDESIVSGVLFRDEREGQYFRLFRDELAGRLSAGFELTLWGQIVLQACDHPAIRQLTVATAAMSKAQDTIVDEAQSVLHRRYALRVYDQALKGVRSGMIRGQDIRATLIAALLIFVFESMQGCWKTALMSIQSATEMMNQRMLPTSPDAQEDLAVKIYQRCEKNRCQIEDEVVKAFVRLDRPAISLLTRNLESGIARKWAMSCKWFHIPYEIPSVFETLNQARYCYERIRFRVFPEDLFEKKNSASRRTTQGSSAPAMLLMELFAETADSATAPQLRHEMGQWHRAFAPLQTFSKTVAGGKTFIPTSTLSIGASSLDLPLHTIETHARCYPIQDSARNAARAVITLSQAQVAHPDFSFGYVLEMGIIVPLWMVVVLCPDLHLKREAVKVLRSIQPRVECVWDSRVVADTADIFIRDAEIQAEYTATMVFKSCS